MTQQITTTEYADFVDKVTSKPSSDFDAMVDRLTELRDNGANVPRLMTSAYGLSAEAGEFTEIIKKIVWQGKNYSEDNIRHMRIELSDVAFYLQLACSALDTTIDEVLQMNFDKLSARYPEGTFTVSRSENRKEGDL